MLRGHVRIPLPCHEPLQCSKGPVPAIVIRLRPSPSWHAFEARTVVPLPLDPSHAKVLPLARDPGVKAHTTLDVSCRNPEVALSLLEADERAVAPVPLVETTLPGPARKRDQPSDLLLGQPPAAVDTVEHVA